jgi:hypothetical protein
MQISIRRLPEYAMLFESLAGNESEPCVDVGEE